MFELDGFGALALAAVNDAGPVLAGELGASLDEFDAAGLAELLDAAGELVDHAVFPVDSGREVHGGVGVDAHVFGRAGVVGDVGGRYQRLGGDTAVVQAGPPVGVGLDERDVQIELSGADGGDVAARPPADDQYVRPGSDVSDDHCRTDGCRGHKFGGGRGHRSRRQTFQTRANCRSYSRDVTTPRQSKTSSTDVSVSVLQRRGCERDGRRPGSALTDGSELWPLFDARALFGIFGVGHDVAPRYR